MAKVILQDMTPNIEYAKYIMNLHENLKPLMEEALKAR